VVVPPKAILPPVHLRGCGGRRRCQGLGVGRGA
jgi:hypothetical protein